MATTPDPLDIFNAVETAAVNAINADSWLGDTANVKTVHEKIRRDENLDPTYIQEETPAIGIYCPGGPGDSVENLNTSDQQLRVEFDVVVMSGDPKAGDTLCKQIVSRLRRLMRIQAYNGTYPEATNLDGFAEDGDIMVNNEVSFTVVDNGSGYWCEGAAAITVKLFSQE